MNLARFANKYFNDKEPWKTRSENPEDCANTIHLCLQTVRILGILMEPLIPFTADKIRRILNIQDKEQWDSAAELLLKPGHVIDKPQILFSKIEDDIIDAEIEKLHNTRDKKTQENIIEDIKALIEFNDFSKLDLRVAKVIAAEKVPKTDKLLKLTVDIGIEQRIIISGIAGQYKPEDLTGKNIVIIANLKPAKIRGIESKGMLLTSENNGQLSLLTVMSEIPAGSKIS
jgi:methionyl-tRNA synthetase